MKPRILPVLSFLSFCSLGRALECYQCSEQDDNDGDCTSKTVQCDQFQDACTSYIRWAVPPYWTPRGDREYYISKDCDTRQGCDRRQSALQTHCNRDWYNDWACVECCTGDLCNYYVTRIDRYGRIISEGSITSEINLFSLVVTSCISVWLQQSL